MPGGNLISFTRLFRNLPRCFWSAPRNNHGAFEKKAIILLASLKIMLSSAAVRLQLQSVFLKYSLNLQAICDEKGLFKEVSSKQRH